MRNAWEEEKAGIGKLLAVVCFLERKVKRMSVFIRKKERERERERERVKENRRV